MFVRSSIPLGNTSSKLEMILSPSTNVIRANLPELIVGEELVFWCATYGTYYDARGFLIPRGGGVCYTAAIRPTSP